MSHNHNTTTMSTTADISATTTASSRSATTIEFGDHFCLSVCIKRFFTFFVHRYRTIPDRFPFLWLFRFLNSHALTTLPLLEPDSLFLLLYTLTVIPSQQSASALFPSLSLFNFLTLSCLFQAENLSALVLCLLDQMNSLRI